MSNHLDIIGDEFFDSLDEVVVVLGDDFVEEFVEGLALVGVVVF
jgi:hypothetical protein